VWQRLDEQIDEFVGIAAGGSVQEVVVVAERDGLVEPDLPADVRCDVEVERIEDVPNPELDLDEFVAQQRALALDGGDGVAGDLPELAEHSSFLATERAGSIRVHGQDAVDRLFVADRDDRHRLVAVLAGDVAPPLEYRAFEDVVDDLHLPSSESGRATAVDFEHQTSILPAAQDGEYGSRVARSDRGSGGTHLQRRT
jgi:hypothetical protein